MAIDSTSFQALGGSPYGPTYYGTAGDVAADGTHLSMMDAATIASMGQQFGDNASFIWAQQRNQQLIATGQAIATPDGPQMITQVVSLLQQHGYTGPLDANSVAAAYKMLRTPPPAPATQAVGGQPSANVSGALKSIPQPVLIGGGALLVFFLLFRGGRG